MFEKSKRQLSSIFGMPGAIPGVQGQLGRIDDSLALFENRSFRKGRVPGAFAVTGLTGDPRFHKGIFFQIDTSGMATAAFQQPRPFVPVFLMVIDPAMGIGVVLNGRDEQGVIFFYQITLLPLAADGVEDLVQLGDINLIRRHFKLVA